MTRQGNHVEMRLTLPSVNVDGSQPVVLDRVEIYAITAAPGASAPSYKQITDSKRLVGRIEVRPTPKPGDIEDPDAPTDTRPRPGETVTFIEELTPEALTPVLLPRVLKPGEAAKKAAAAANGTGKSATSPTAPAGTTISLGATAVTTPPETPPATTPPGTPPVTGAATGNAAIDPETLLPVEPALLAPPPPPVKYGSRYYVAVAYAHGHLSSGGAAMLAIPFGPPPDAPTVLDPTYDETTVTLTWVGANPDWSYRVYSVNENGVRLPGQTMLPPLLATMTTAVPVDFTAKHCWVVRAAGVIGTLAGGQVVVESDPSDVKCVTAVDTFPPAAPSELIAVPGGGVMNLNWKAVDAPDLAGYLVLRGIATDDPQFQHFDTLEQGKLVVGTTYQDKTTQTGVHYIYAVVAVDKAGNRSPESNHFPVTGGAPLVAGIHRD